MLRKSVLLIALWPGLLHGDDAVEGKRLFALHCAACHGTDARGAGTVAGALEENPADLTRLERRNNGIFPTNQTIEKIDGRAQLSSHGGSMPVYGWFFEGPAATITTPDGETVETTRAISQIVAWLEAQQR